MNNNFYLCTFSSVLLFGSGKEYREWDSKMITIERTVLIGRSHSLDGNLDVLLMNCSLTQMLTGAS